MNAVLVPFAIVRCLVTLGGRSASRPWRRACRRVASISLLLALAAVLLALSPSAVEAGEVIAWGWDSYGQCNVPPAAQSGVTAIAGGEGHSLALTNTGEVIAWGDNYYGQCTVPPAAASGVIAIAAGDSHSLALTSAGEVIAWGYNFQGQCSVPTAAESGVIAIAGGRFHSLALTDTGEVIAWGWSFYGQCAVPTAAQSGVIAIAAAAWHSLALTDTGQVIAWGYSGEGQCNVPLAAQSGVIAIAGGGFYSLALTEAGAVIAWGYNDVGQCNVPLAAQSGVIAIAAGVFHSLALTEAGQVIAWGSNHYGQCNVPLAAQSGVLAIAGGAVHSLALLPAPPEADFSGSPTSGPAPLTVSFTDLSTDSPTAWQWDFGDGGADTVQDPTHEYASPGLYTVSMTGTNADGSDTETKADYITVTLAPPVAEFSGSPTSGTVPLTVSFTDLSTNSPTAWQWDFGDGGASTEQNPSYTYLLAGIYTPSMTATNAGGSDTETKARYIVVDFVDVAQDNWAYGDIMACADADIVTGYPDGTYQPDGPVDRAEMAAYISRALAGGDEHVPEGPMEPTFGDVAADHWAYKHVEYCLTNGIVQGYWDGYHPGEVLNRAQTAVFIARSMATPTGEDGLVGYDPPAAPTFPDVPNTGYGTRGMYPFWAYKHIEYCVENGVVQGYDDGLYCPDRDVTRDQMAVYIARAFGLAM
jgi:PKD repeat protein